MNNLNELKKHARKIAKCDGFTIKQVNGGGWAIFERGTNTMYGFENSFMYVYESLMAGFYDRFKKDNH